MSDENITKFELDESDLPHLSNAPAKRLDSMSDEEIEKAALSDPVGRSARLREMYWNKTHHSALIQKHIAGSGEDTLTGHAKDFVALLEASDPFIQPDELIVGCCLSIPYDRASIDLGYYNPHYPPGHETILSMGLAGIRNNARERLRTETDPEKREFLRAIEISYDAACKYVEKYARCAREMATSEADSRRRKDLFGISAVCYELATAVPSSFRAALQLLQFTRVFGGYGSIGRFDQWMYPFYEKEMEAGEITQQEAQELLECLFVKLNQFADVNEATPQVNAKNDPIVSVDNDDLRNITLAGQTPDGKDACNELTYMCLEASAKLMLPEPKLNVRVFHQSPRRLLRECCRVLAKGANILAIYNDEIVIPALSGLGIPLEDARNYCNDGCSELLIGGKSTVQFTVHDSLPALTETVLEAEHHPFAEFDDVMADFKSRLVPFMSGGHNGESAIRFPYFAASVQDCLQEASPTGVRYGIRGAILSEVGNVADGLAAIKKLIYEDEMLAWDELVAAIKANYEGYESIRQMLLNRAPKYGNDDDYVDAIVKEITEYFCDGVHERAGNSTGHGPKWAAGFMSFGIHNKNDLPASPDGRRQGDLTANSFSPSVGMDKSGPTAVFKSVAKVDLTKASHGSVLDLALHSSMVRGEEGFEKFVALVDSFLKLPCAATLQLNIIDRDILLKARDNPNAPEFKTLIVRVWGFSAVFVELPRALQDHILTRTEHRL